MLQFNLFILCLRKEKRKQILAMELDRHYGREAIWNFLFL